MGSHLDDDERLYCEGSWKFHSEYQILKVSFFFFVGITFPVALLRQLIAAKCKLGTWKIHNCVAIIFAFIFRQNDAMKLLCPRKLWKLSKPNRGRTQPPSTWSCSKRLNLSELVHFSKTLFFFSVHMPFIELKIQILNAIQCIYTRVDLTYMKKFKIIQFFTLRSSQPDPSSLSGCSTSMKFILKKSTEYM